MAEAESRPLSLARLSGSREADASAKGVVTLSMLRSGDEVERIRSEWERLAGSAPCAFQSFGWNRAWIRHFENQYEQLAVYVLYRNHKALAILPCFRNGRCLRLIGDEICDFQDVIALDRADARALVAAVLQSVKAEDRYFDFRKLSEAGMLRSILKESAGEYGFSFFQKNYGRCPWFPMADSAAGYLGQCKPRLRKRIRRALRRLDDLAPDAERRFLDEKAICRETINDVARLHRANQYRKKGPSIFEKQAYLDFLTEAGNRPDVGMRVLEIRNRDGDLVAFDLGFECGDRFYAYLGSFEKAYAAASPGMCLLFWQMDVFPLRGINHYDFLCGEEPYKFDYATETCEISSVRVYAATFRNRSVLFQLRCFEAVKKCVKALVSKWR